MKKKALIGREKDRSERLRAQLQATYTDLEIISLPFISTEAVPFELPEVEPQSHKIPLYLFTSPRAVEFFFDSATLPEGATVASIGRSTTRTLCERGIEPHFTSSIESAKGMAPELFQYIKFHALEYKIIQPTSNIAGEYLNSYFDERGFDYTLVTTYQVESNPELPSLLAEVGTDPEWVVFYSPSGVQSWCEATDTRPLAFSIGEVTTSALREAGWSVIHESQSPHELDIINVITRNYLI